MVVSPLGRMVYTSVALIPIGERYLEADGLF